MPLRVSSTCAHHQEVNVEFYSKNMFEKLVRLFGFIIRIYHDGRSPERQKINFIITYYDV